MLVALILGHKMVDTLADVVIFPFVKNVLHENCHQVDKKPSIQDKIIHIGQGVGTFIFGGPLVPRDCDVIEDLSGNGRHSLPAKHAGVVHC